VPSSRRRASSTAGSTAVADEPRVTPDAMPDEYEISSDPARLDVDRVHRWLSTDAYWALGRERAVTERAIAGSLMFGVYRRPAGEQAAGEEAAGEQVAVARVVTDGATFAWLCDVYVEPGVRGAGVGTRLVGVVRDHLRALGVRRILLRTRDAHGVYGRFGFAALDRPDQWMELALPAGGASTPA
jgi:GNAT superfamily N-acetyltransferase